MWSLSLTVYVFFEPYFSWSNLDTTQHKRKILQNVQLFTAKLCLFFQCQHTVPHPPCKVICQLCHTWALRRSYFCTITCICKSIKLDHFCISFWPIKHPHSLINCTHVSSSSIASPFAQIFHCSTISIQYHFIAYWHTTNAYSLHFTTSNNDKTCLKYMSSS